jgi:hypothetical protein
MTLERKALEMRNALDGIELALMGVENLSALPALFETTGENVQIVLRMTVGQMRQICAALGECNRIVNSPDFIPSALAAAGRSAEIERLRARIAELERDLSEAI